MAEYRRNQEMLAQVPPSTPAGFTADAPAARTIVTSALSAGRELLGEIEAKQVLQAYGIPVVMTRLATSPDSAAGIAAELGFPVALKIFSADLSHKSDVGGVALNLHSAAAVREAAEAMRARVHALRPQARLDGFTVQPMVHRPGAHELIVGAATDPTFGPVVLFGQGGTAVEVIGDRAVALPPLNMVLARELVSRTRISRLLAAHRDQPAADIDAICRVLMQVAQLIADIPEVVELDLNPLLADGSTSRTGMSVS